VVLESGSAGDIFEPAIAGVSEKMALSDAANENVREAIVVVVADSNSHADISSSRPAARVTSKKVPLRLLRYKRNVDFRR